MHTPETPPETTPREPDADVNGVPEEPGSGIAAAIALLIALGAFIAAVAGVLLRYRLFHP